MNTLKEGWFSELSPFWPGQALSLEVEEILYDQHSQYQHIVVFKSKSYGTVLALDGVIQATEKDEFAYQEMLAHLPLCSHPDPKKVLVIGGGDGGVLREVAKHSMVEEITLCEIDEKVIEVSKKYLPWMAKGFDDPRVKVHIGDGCAYMRERPGQFDVIIVDSSDPIGPAETLYQQPFYQYMKESLRAGGIVCTQAECLWIHLDFIKDLLEFASKLYKKAEYAYTTIPTYPSGQIGFLLCSLNEAGCKKPVRKIDEEELKYYNTEIHAASFVLPQFSRKSLGWKT